MRVIRLKVQNLTSLRGEHEIEFNELSSDHSGQDLFAITGPTGSGKSTLLAAIGLALYGNHYKSTLNQSDVVSEAEGYGKVELDFSLGGEPYRAVWECRTKKANGERLKIPKITRALYHNEMALEKSAEEVLGMNFSQFCRTVILHQGEFAKFLSSSFTERKIILEKLAHAQELQLIGKVLREKLRKLEGQMNELEAQRALFQSFSTPDLESLAQKISQYQIAKQWAQSTLTYLSSFQDKISALVSLLKEKENLVSEVQILEQSLLKRKTNLNQWRDQQENLEKEITKAQKDLILSQEIFNQVMILKERQNLWSKSLDKTTQLWVQLTQEFTLLENRIKQTKEKRQVQQDKSAELWNSLFKNSPPQGPQELQLVLENMEKSLVQTNEAHERILAFTIYWQTQWEYLESVIKAIFEKAERSKILAGQLQNLAQASVKKQTQIDQLEQAQLENRKHLARVLCLEEAKATGTCPVCLSAFSSKAKENAQPPIPFSEELLLSVQREAHEINKKIYLAQETRQQLQKEIENLGEEFLAKAKSLHCRRQNVLELVSSPWPLPSDRIELRTFLLTVGNGQLEHHSSLREFIEQMYQKLAHFEQQKSDLEGKIQVMQKVGQINEWIVSQRALEAELQQSLDKLAKDISKTLQESEKLKFDLKQVKAEILERGGGVDPELRLKKIKDEFTQLESKGKKLQQSLHQQELEITKERRSLEIKHETKCLRQKEIEKLCDFLRPQQETLQTLGPDFDPGTMNFSLNIQGHLTDYLKQFAELKNEPLEFRLELLLKYNVLVQKTLLSLETLQELVSESMIELKSEKQKAVENQKLEKQIMAQIKVLFQEQTRWETLSQILGKDEFRNFTLAMVEEALMNYANKELEKLCDGRYRLLHKDTRKNNLQEFFIVDRLQGGVHRKASTLSGGETFLVSLALSLALSEMSRGSSHIDSFFIDEGFGTLDRDSLEEVLEVLYALQGRGKQIGLISHIKDLTSRIPLNIELQKSSLGEARVQIVYN